MKSPFPWFRAMALCVLAATGIGCGDGPTGLDDFVPCTGPAPSDQNAGFIHGTVLAAEDDAPVSGAAIRVDGIDGCVATESDGTFVFPLSNGGGFKMTVTARARTHGRRPGSVQAGRDINLGSFVLPLRDTAITTIGSAGGTHRSARGGLELTFPAGALDGDRQVSATRFGAGRELPGKLPETSHFTMALEAVAGDGNLNEPVTITIPNDYGFLPGTPVPVGVFNEETGEWVPDGMGTISEDGTQVVYQARHFSSFDCNFPVTSSGRPGLVGKDPRRKKDPCGRNSSSGNSIVDIRSGTIRLDFDLPVGRLGGVERTVGLVYQSAAASPWVWTGGPWSDQASNPEAPEYVGIEVQVEGLLERIFMNDNPEGNWAAYMWDGRNGRGERLRTGLYDGWIRVYGAQKGIFAEAAVFGGQPTASLGVEADELVEADTTITTRFQLVNGSESPVGNGWYIKGIPDLYPHPDGSVMVVMDGESGGVYLPDIMADIVAGGGGGTECGDGSPATNDCLDYPDDLAVAPDGSLITTDSWTNSLIRIDTDGLIQTIYSGAGDGVDFKAVAVSPDGIVHFSDSNSGKVFKLVDGQAEFVIGGDLPDIFNQAPAVSNPTDLDFDAEGNLYIADWPLGLRVLLADGMLMNAYAGDNPDIPAPSAIDVTADGSILLVEPARQRVRRLTADGQILPVAGLDGDSGFDGDGWLAAKARLFMPSGVAQGPDGTVYIADEYNDRIRSVGPDGMIRTFAGKGAVAGSSTGDHGPATEISLKEPLAPVVDAQGNVLALDRGAGLIWKFNKAESVFARPASQNDVLSRQEGGDGFVLNTDSVDYRFDDDGRCVAYTDRTGMEATLARDQSGRLTAIDFGSLGQVSFEYDDNGLAAIKAGTRQMDVLVDADSNVRSLNWSDGASTELTYDDQGRLTGWSDADGRNANYELDRYGRVSSVSASGGGTRLYRPLETAGLLNDGILRQEGLTPESPAPASGEPSAGFTDENGDEWAFKYDALGEATQVTTPDGTVITIGNHTCGMPSTMSSPGLEFRTWFYNDDGGMLIERGPEGDHSYEWDEDAGTLTGVVTPGGRYYQYEYDEQGRVTGVTASGRKMFTFLYGEGTRLTGIRDALDRVTDFATDELGNLESVTQSGLEVARFERNDNGDIVAFTDAIGGRTEFLLDGMGRISSVQDRAGATHHIGRDQAGQVVSLSTTATGLEDRSGTTWERDGRGRVAAVTINGAGPWTIDWVGADRVGAISSPAGTVDATYDKNGRVVTRAITGLDPSISTSLATYRYDAAGRLISAVDDDSSVTFEYDVDTGALTSVTQQYQGMPEPVTIEYETDADGVVTGIGYPALDGFDGGWFNYSYDGPTGLLTDITAPDGRYWDLYRDDIGRIEEFEIDWGETFEYGRTYDEFGRIESMVAWLDYYREDEHARFEYQSDNDGVIVSATGPDGATTFGFDAMRRLASATCAGCGIDEAFEYDGRGDPVGTGITVDALGRLTAANGHTWTFDDAGRVVSRVSTADGSRVEFQWDADDNLVMARTFESGNGSPVHEIRYGYDALGRRVYREVDGVRQFFIHDFTDVVMEMNQAGGVDAFYLHEPAMDNPLGMYRDGEWYAVIADGLGSIRGLVRLSDRTLVRTWSYSPFGRLAGTSGTIEFRYGFQGRETDPLTGLIHFRARELDPMADRFISTDPEKFTSLAGTYTFAGNDPINRRDPTGVGPRVVRGAGELYSYYNDQKSKIEKGVEQRVGQVGGRDAGAAAGFIWKNTGSGMIDSVAKITLPTPYQGPGPSLTDAAVYMYKAYKAKDPCGRAKVGGDVLVDIMPGGDKWLRPMVDSFNGLGDMIDVGR
ncbi:MAG TPA: RHS repeat-associated core domain-containing protein [Myxococcota bacterium]|nr:RHS repeat-associated core domain-containing protein [Myxococcota bacterium]